MTQRLGVDEKSGLGVYQGKLIQRKAATLLSSIDCCVPISGGCWDRVTRNYGE